MAKAKTPDKKTKPDIIDVPGTGLDTGLEVMGTSDQALAAQAWPVISEFFKGLTVFFRKASELEAGAEVLLSVARALKPPTNAAEDVKVQELIKSASTHRKAIEEHWGITSVVWNFQKRLVAARDRGAKQAETAAAVAQTLHNQYTDAERRRAAAEQERVRREAEDRARAERDAEQARLEAEAVKREEASPDLSERERAFVDYVTGPYSGDGQRAAQQAGFRDPLKAAARLLSNTKIQKAIKLRREALAIRQQAAAKKVQPLDVQVETVKPDISRAAGASDRTFWSGEVLDAAATIEAFRQGKHGIPGDLFQINQSKLNDYARSLHERLDLWPGCRAKKTTSTV